MNRLLPATVAALLLITACSTGGDDDAATTTTAEATTTTEAPTTTTEVVDPDTASLEEWAEGFCGAFADWTAGIEDLGETSKNEIAAASTPSGARDAVVATFEGATALTDELIEAVTSQDPPDMDDGQGMVDAFAAKFQEFADVIEASQVRAEAVDVNAADFAEQVQTIYTDFENDFASIGNSFGEIDREYPDPEFQAALSSACSV